MQGGADDVDVLFALAAGGVEHARDVLVRAGVEMLER